MEACIMERQYRQTLGYSGQAFIIFGIWSAVKLMLQAYLNPIDWAGLGALDEIPARTLEIAAYCIWVFFLTADILIRLYVGLSAIKEARGKPRTVVYLVAAALCIVLTVVSLLPNKYDKDQKYTFSFVTFFFDATNMITLAVIIVDSWRLRKLRGLEGN